MFNFSKYAQQGVLDGALEGLGQATDDAYNLISPNQESDLKTEDLAQGLTDDQAAAAYDIARANKWNKIVAALGQQVSPEVVRAIEGMDEFKDWQPKIQNASISAPETLINEQMEGAEAPLGAALEQQYDPDEQKILNRARKIQQDMDNKADQQAVWNQQAYSRAAFNLKQHKTAQMPMPEAPMPEAPMPAAPMPQEQMPQEQMPQEQMGRFPVANEGDFITKFAEDLLAFNNQPGTQEYERARIAAEEIRETVSPGFEEEANSILESVMQLDDTQRDQASNYLIKLYEVLIPPALKGDQNGSQMEPVMSDNNQDAVEGIVRFSLTDSVLNNKSMTKTAADQFGQQYLLYGPTEKRICPKLRSKNLSVGDVVSEYTCRHHCLDGIVIDDNKTICGEALWRAHSMDKYSREYVDADGNIEGGYLNKRFETNRNVPEENKMRLKPGETRKPRPAEWGNTESRLQAMRAKEGQNRDYRPTTNTGDPFEWCHDSDQNNVEVSQTERDRRETAAGNELVQYTKRDQGENNPKKAFNLKLHKTAQYTGCNCGKAECPKCQGEGPSTSCNCGKEECPKCQGENQNKTAQSPIVYKPMDKPNIAVNPSAAGVDKPSDIQSLKGQGMDSGKPMKKKKTESKEKKASGFNLNQFKKEAENPQPHQVPMPDIEFNEQHDSQDSSSPKVRPSKKKT